MERLSTELYSRLVSMCDLVPPMAIRAGVTVGVFGLLGERKLNLKEISSKLGIPYVKMHILLSALTDLNLIDSDPSGDFQLSDLGKLLSDENNAFNKSLNLGTAVGQYDFSITHLIQVLQGHPNYFTQRFSADYWSFVESNADDLKIISSLASPEANFEAEQFITENFWTRTKRVIDLGGGNGNILIAVARKYPHISGAVFDLPGRVQSARELIEKSNLSARIDALGGSFFSPLPKEFDCYLLNAILADWSDEQCISLLSNVRKSMDSDNLLVISEVDPSAAFDDSGIHLKMICAAEGWVRTPEEVETLARDSGFQLVYFAGYVNRYVQVYKKDS